MASMKWALTDLAGNLLSGLENRLPGGSVRIEHNGQRVANVAVPIESQEAGLVSAFDTALKVWLDDDLVFRGPIITPRWAGGAALQGGAAGPLTVEYGHRHHRELIEQPQGHRPPRPPEYRHIRPKGGEIEIDPQGGGGGGDTCDIAAVDPSAHFEETPTLGSELRTTTGRTTAGFHLLTNVASPTGIKIGMVAFGDGIPDGAKVVDVPGGSSGLATDEIDLDQNATADHIGADLTFLKAILSFDTVDQSELLAQLMELHDDYVASYGGGGQVAGVIRGTLAAPSVNRSRFYSSGSNLWESMTDIADLFDGIDFELQPIDTTDGTMAKLNTFYPRQGSDKSASVVFEFNLGRHNLGAFAHEPGGGQLTNFFIAAGKPSGQITLEGAVWDKGPMVIARHLGSIAQYGLYGDFESDGDITSIGALTNKAKRIVGARAFPIDFVEITPTVEQNSVAYAWARRDDGHLAPVGGQGYSAPPKFGPSGDYWIGDTVGVIARDAPGVDVDTQVRVLDAAISEADETGAVVVELTCAPTDTAAAGVDVIDNLPAYAVEQVIHGHKHRRHHHRRHHHRHPHRRHGHGG